MLGKEGGRQIKLLKFMSRDLQNLIWIIYCVHYIFLMLLTDYPEELEKYDVFKNNKNIKEKIMEILKMLNIKNYLFDSLVDLIKFDHEIGDKNKNKMNA